MRKPMLRILACMLTLVLMLTGVAHAVDIVYPDHVLLAWRGSGSCQALTGNVTVTVVFVALPDAPWNDDAMQARKDSIAAAMDRLEDEAAAFGAELSITAEYHSASAQEVASIAGNSEDWAADVLDSAANLAPLTYGDDTPTYYQGMPLLFCLNTGGRAFAHSESSDKSAEYLILFADDGASVVRHELLHLYGTKDYYLVPEIELAAESYFPDSIMLSSSDENKVDSLTAYIIGWSNQPDETAHSLLQATAHITRDDVDAAKEQDRITGYGVKEGSDYTYSGMMIDGSWHGYGTITWDSGSSYEGDWVWGERTGRGTYTWDNGNTYTGDFINGNRTGQGTFIWSYNSEWAGDSYTGDFINNDRTGRGTYTWANGNTYTGDFVDGVRTGYGTYTWANGDIYTGEFVDGARTGHGTLVWSQSGEWAGESYTGDFVDGKRTGRGTYTWASGNTYTGDFVENARTGHGTYTWASGDTYTGGFADGVRTGYGTYIWASGASYTGEFVDGQRSGYGIYRSADGKITTGRWENNEYIGE